jgi:hypothetical protein
MAVSRRSGTPEALIVLMNAAHAVNARKSISGYNSSQVKPKNKTVQHAAAGSPIPTPAVALQPRIPARAMGVPTTKQNTTQITAAAE